MDGSDTVQRQKQHIRGFASASDAYKRVIVCLSVLVCLLQTCGFYLCIVHRTLDACGEHTMCPCSHPSNVDAQCTGVCVPYGKLSPLAVGHIVARQPVIISL